jgi:hypothetical protein
LIVLAQDVQIQLVRPPIWIGGSRIACGVSTMHHWAKSGIVFHRYPPILRFA